MRRWWNHERTWFELFSLSSSQIEGCIESSSAASNKEPFSNCLPETEMPAWSAQTPHQTALKRWVSYRFSARLFPYKVKMFSSRHGQPCPNKFKVRLLQCTLCRRLPDFSQSPSQLVQNAAARLLTNTNRRVHITSVLNSLHWLPVLYRIDFKLLMFCFYSS